jgi:hypothetical protein
MTKDKAQVAVDELEVQRRVKQMRDEELVDFIRETVTHLEVLAQRLEVLAETHTIEGDQEDAG